MPTFPKPSRPKFLDTEFETFVRELSPEALKLVRLKIRHRKLLAVKAQKEEVLQRAKLDWVEASQAEVIASLELTEHRIPNTTKRERHGLAWLSQEDLEKAEQLLEAPEEA